MKDNTPPATLPEREPSNHASPLADRLAKPAVTIDWERYLEPLADWDVSDEVKREFVETLYSMLASFADLGFNVSPVQQTCGEVIDIGRLLEGDLLNSKPEPVQEFDAAVIGAGVMFKGNE